MSAPRGVSAPGGVCSRGVCLLQGGVSAPGGYAPGEYPPGGWCLLRGGGVDGITDACKNITLPQLRCGR